MIMTYYSLGDRYSQDAVNFISWFSAEMEGAKQNPYMMSAIPYIMRKIRSTPGLVDTVGFLNDIYDRMDMAVDYVNIMCLRPGGTTGIWAEKVRSAPTPGVNNLYDPGLPDRNILLFVPMLGINDSLKIHWISQEDSRKVSGAKMLPSTGFSFEETTVFGSDSFIADVTRRCVFDNSTNSDYAYFLKIGFEENPTFEQVKSKLETLD